MIRYRARLVAVAVAAAVVAAATAAAQPPTPAKPGPQPKNLRLVAQSTLNGNGDAGEGMAVQVLNGRRLLYVAHEGMKTCLSILDVTDTKHPAMITQFPSPNPDTVRCNSLGLNGTVLAVANQPGGAGNFLLGKKPAGMWLLDVSNLDRIKASKTLDDLKLSFFDTSGPQSPGVHWLWFGDPDFVHLTTGSADSKPTNPAKDSQFYMIVDVRDPKTPREVGRWWLPGTQTGDSCLPGCLPVRQAVDAGFRPHNVQVYPERPDRAYLAYIDGGMMIMDISGLAEVRSGKAKTFTPKLISRLDYSPPFPAWTHTIQPYFSHGIAIVNDEGLEPHCVAGPKLTWVVDIRTETNPVIVGTVPLPENVAELCAQSSYGAHNLAPNYAGATFAQLKNTFLSTYLNGGVKIFRIVPQGMKGAPPLIKELAFYTTTDGAMMNHVIIDERQTIYVTERSKGGVFILEYTGSDPLD
jgi:hypothetical protein